MDNPGTILIIDDSPADITMLSAALAAGFAVKTAATGEQALASIAATAPDLILLDIHMPVMNGFAVCRRLKERPETRDIPVIFLTRADDVNSKAEIFSLGAADYVNMPFQPEELISRITTHLELSRLSRELQYKPLPLEKANNKLPGSGDRFNNFAATVANSTYNWEYWVAPDLGIIYCSPACERISGYRAAEFEQDPGLLIAIAHPDDRERIKRHEDDIVRSNPETLEHEYRIVTRSGEVRWIAHACRIVLGSNGEYLGRRASNRDITDDVQMKELQVFLAQTSSGPGDEPFFNSLARHLAESLDMDFICIDRLEGDGLLATTLTVWCDGHFEDNVTYALKDTPCGDVIGKTVCCYPERVCESFPHDQALRDLRAESYLGVTLWSHASQPIGLIAAIGRTPLKNRRLAEEILKVVAIRAAGELERLDGEAALRKSEQRYRNLLMNLDAGVIVHGADTSVIMNNPRAAELLRLNEAQMRDKQATNPVWELLNEAGAPLPIEEYPVNRILAGGKPVHNVLAGVRQPVTNDLVWLLINGFPVFNHKDELAEIVISFFDITDRKLAEESLMRSKEEFRRLSIEFHGLLDAIPDSIILLDRNLKVLWGNRTAAATIGLTPDTVGGQHCYTLWCKQTTPCAPCPAMKSFASGEVHIETTAMHDGRIWDLRTIPLTDDKGAVESVIEVGRDITEHRRLEDQLHHSQKLESIGTLASGIAHDFNNILTTISGYAQITLMNMSENDPQRHNIECVLQGSERAAHLTQDLLLFSRKQSSDKRPVNINEMVAKVGKFLKKVIGEDIAYTTVMQETPITVLADGHQLEQVLMNLATNARDSMPDGGDLTVTTGTLTLDSRFVSLHGYGRPGLYAFITVADTGMGMDEATQQRIFEPFFTTKDVGKGTGLGLAVVYGIIKQHDGYINVYSEAGTGTVFKIYLPALVAKTEEVSRTLPEPAIVGGTETILLAEDDEMVRNLTKQILTEFGYKVVEAKDGLEAVNKFAENSEIINLLLLDLIMPKMNGKEVIDEVRKVQPGIKAIFSSGYSPDTVRNKLSTEMNIHLINKPATPRDLLQMVRSVLDG